MSNLFPPTPLSKKGLFLGPLMVIPVLFVTTLALLSFGYAVGAIWVTMMVCVVAVPLSYMLTLAVGWPYCRYSQRRGALTLLNVLCGAAVCGAVTGALLCLATGRLRVGELALAE
jgi:ABC-type sulfate transport system permease subunit